MGGSGGGTLARRLKLRLLPEARDDLASALAWYAEQGAHLPRVLRTEVKKTLALIQENPRLYAPVLDEVRQATLSRFPYSVLYFEWEGHDTVIVLAVFHQARDPEVWEERWTGAVGS